MPAQVRLRQLETNLARLRAMSGNLGHRFVICNIPAAQIEAIEDGVAVTATPPCVGKLDRPSPPVIQSRIIEINFNPYWTVPVSIVPQGPDPEDAGRAGLSRQERIRIFDPAAASSRPRRSTGIRKRR